MTEAAPRPLPLPDPDTEAFWEACRRGEYLLQRNRVTGEYRWPPGPMVEVPGYQEWEWVPASGRGRVYSFCVVHHPAHPHWRDKVPYSVAIVELEEGVRVVGNVLDVEPGSLRIGMPVQVVFEEAGDDVVLPQFRPAG